MNNSQGQTATAMAYQSVFGQFSLISTEIIENQRKKAVFTLKKELRSDSSAQADEHNICFIIQYLITFSTSKTVVSGEFEVDNPPFGSKNIETGEFAAKIPPTPPQSCTVTRVLHKHSSFTPHKQSRFIRARE